MTDYMAVTRERIARLAQLLDGKPHFEWALVTSEDPLRIHFPGDASPMKIAPDSLVSGLRVGDLVRVERVGAYTLIHDVSGVGQHRAFPSKSDLDDWQAPDGTLAFVSDEGRHYTYVGGEWRSPNALPASQVVNYNDATTITAASGVWQNVPNLSTITFEDVPAPLEVRVSFGAVAYATSGYSMLGVLTSGATSLNERTLTTGGVECVGAHTPLTSGADIQMYGFKMLTLNPGSTTFRLRSRRNVSSGTQAVNYPTMLVEPIQWRI